MKPVTIEDAPAVLNINDKAMWVLGFNEALERCAAEVNGLDCAHRCGVGSEIAARLNGAPAVGVPVELDAAGQPKPPLTLLEQNAIATLNTIKAWRDSDGNEPFPDGARERMELVLMLASARRKGVR